MFGKIRGAINIVAVIFPTTKPINTNAIALLHFIHGGDRSVRDTN